MYLDKDSIDRFRGTDELNSAGEDLLIFLEKYDATKYLNPSNTVDTLVFTYTEDVTEGEVIRHISKILLIKRGNHPSIGWWALPGGFVEFKENLEAAALRELQEETGITDIEVSQLKCYGDYDRDPRTRVITTAYVALVPEGSVKAKAGDDASDSGWFYISENLVGTETDDSRKKEYYDLRLTNSLNDLQVSANIEVSEPVSGFFKEKKYRVISSDGLAADHGAIILEGYFFVKNILS